MSDDTFDGFVIPEKNYFPMPNEWIDICAGIDNLAELKIIQYVLRHTWGYHEYGITKAITVEEFMHGRKRNDGTRIDKGTGLKSDRSVKDGIKLASKHGYIVCEVDTTDLARIKKSYALKMITPKPEGYNLPPTQNDVRGVQSTPPNRQVVSTPLAGSIYPSSGYNLPLGGANTTPRTEKDTIERHLRKTPEEIQSFAALAPTLSNFSLLGDLTEDDLTIDEEDITDTPTVHRLQVVRPRESEQKSTTSKPAQGTPPVHVEAVLEQDAPGHNENNSHSQLSTPSTSYAQPEQQALMLVPPRQSARQQKKAPVVKPAKEAKPEPTSEEATLQARCKTWYDRITEWCGGPMTKGGQVINEHKTIKLACQKFSDTQLEWIFTYLTTRDWKYSKIDNKYTVRCYILWEESGRVAQILKEERQSKGQLTHATPLSAAISATRDLNKEMATLEARWTNRKRVQA